MHYLCTPLAGFTGPVEFDYTINDNGTPAASASATLHILVTYCIQPLTPSAPFIGTIIQPTCTLATGSITLGGLPLGSCTIYSGAKTGTGSNVVISGLLPGNYSFKVPNSLGCISNSSADALVNQKPNCLPVAVDDTIKSKENIPIQITVTSNDYDLDGIIDVTTVDLNPSISGIQNTFTIPGEGTYSADINGIVTFTPVNGFTGRTTPV